ncbi:hypothetical protein CAPTEDRAFT_197066 [Capitella teleta]|uniref:Ras-associating domain-containing protein n=1 Tax=Capitella teleta TaxID=283909 RepID=R7TEW5_CAPTE|nr:hypothetical protein CAPTEDRAFT_197066 [Capitella teleta]|eukprot:ELT92269.1 hypothetical protein CAPTEDRAFT_197066 [Capitella teleta]
MAAKKKLKQSVSFGFLKTYFVDSSGPEEQRDDAEVVQETVVTKKKLKQSVSFGVLKTYFVDSGHEQRQDEEVQRIADYDRYLSSLSGLTSADHPDRQHVSRAADRLANMAKDRRGDLLHAENEHRVEAVQDRFPSDDLGLQEGERKSRGSLGRRKSAPGAVLLRSLGGGGRKTASPAASKDFSPDPSSCRPNCLANPNRVYILEGAAQLTVGLQTQERYLFLFNDLLLVAKQKSSTTFKLKHRVRVCEIWLSDCLDEVSVATHSPEKSFVIGWPTTNAVVTFASSESKDLWQSKIREHITSEKGQEQPRAIILKVMNKDMASYSASKCVTVGNQEEAKALVERCLTEFHIQNANPRDYQLWVASGDDDAPYPLIAKVIGRLSYC